MQFKISSRWENRYSQTWQRRATKKHILEKYTFDNVSTTFFPEVHIKGELQELVESYTFNQLCVNDIVRSHFILLEFCQ